MIKKKKDLSIAIFRFQLRIGNSVFKLVGSGGEGFLPMRSDPAPPSSLSLSPGWASAISDSVLGRVGPGHNQGPVCDNLSKLEPCVLTPVTQQPLLHSGCR